MTNYKEKQLTYRRAVWLLDGPAPATLESLIRQTMAKLKTAAARQIQAGEVTSSVVSITNRLAQKVFTCTCPRRLLGNQHP